MYGTYRTKGNVSHEFDKFAETELTILTKKDKTQYALLLNNIKLSELKAILFHSGMCKTNISDKILRIDVSIKLPKLYELIKYIIDYKNNLSDKIYFIICNCYQNGYDFGDNPCNLCNLKMNINCRKQHNNILLLIKEYKLSKSITVDIYCKKNMSTELNIATDGACTGNGKKTAKAAYAVYIPNSVLGDSFSLSDLVSNLNLYEYNNNVLNINEQKIDFSNNQNTDSIKQIIDSTESLKSMFTDSFTEFIQPSNIRAELYAIYYALHYVKHKLDDILKNNISKINIITDSEFSINVYTKWIINWIKKNTFSKKKNLDIIIPTYELLVYLKNQVKIEFIFINSHLTKEQKNNLSKEQSFHSCWNEIADKLATLAINPE